ncbi:MAG: HlyD family efflux transporter periplasmic adaptor subunit [Pirellulaceae bacterium]|nr:HlyD family efflux transporter periplasmic adaptor subunit [Planctomycetales bacterium]
MCGIGSIIQRVFIVMVTAILSALATPICLSAEPLAVDAEIVLGKMVDVPARRQGVVRELLVRPGQTVQAGDMLAILDETEAQFRVNKHQMELDSAQQELDNDVRIRLAIKTRDVAAAELRRAEELNRLKDNGVSPAEMDQRRLEYEKAKLEVEHAEHLRSLAEITRALKANELQAATHDLQMHTIHSVVSGFVDEVFVQPGEWIEQGVSVFRLLRTDELYAECYIKADAVRGDMTGKEVFLRLTDGRAKREAAATVVYQSPLVGPGEDIRVRAKINVVPPWLRAGMTATLIVSQ